MKIKNKLKTISISICCLVASLWSETQCMDLTPNELTNQSNDILKRMSYMEETIQSIGIELGSCKKVIMDKLKEESIADSLRHKAEEEQRIKQATEEKLKYNLRYNNNNQYVTSLQNKKLETWGLWNILEVMKKDYETQIGKTEEQRIKQATEETFKYNQRMLVEMSPLTLTAAEQNTYLVYGLVTTVMNIMDKNHDKGIVKLRGSGFSIGNPYVNDLGHPYKPILSNLITAIINQAVEKEKENQ